MPESEQKIGSATRFCDLDPSTFSRIYPLAAWHIQTWTWWVQPITPRRFMKKSSGFNPIRFYLKGPHLPIPEYLIRLLGIDTWDMRLIGLSLEDNKVSLYHREQQAVVEAGDLLQYVLG